jgi:micrococcal nuclease|tara:strand:- start:4914 stop:5249 length:336 start_codon:yes stop_codon:yes gene_type:complete
MYQYKATLNRIIDGDTIDVNVDLGFDVKIKQRVRLYGINTPEVRTKDLNEKKKGLEATEYLKKILPKEFVIETILNKRGKYGRVLGILWVKDVNINEKMVNEGYAKRYDTK